MSARKTCLFCLFWLATPVLSCEASTARGVNAFAGSSRSLTTIDFPNASSPLLATDSLLPAPRFLQFKGRRIVPVSETTELAFNNPQQSTASSTSFEDLEAGPLLKQEDATGIWSAEENHATIHTQHHRTGEQCLRILGGENRQVEWVPRKHEAEADVDRLEFWFERWTSRKPYEFRVETLVDRKWQSLYFDTKSSVGSFKNRVSLKLEHGPPEKVRFRSTTPAASGVMIDDVRLVIAKPMQVVSVTSRQMRAPILVRNKINPVFDIQIVTDGEITPLSLNAINLLPLSAEQAGNVESVEILSTGTNGATFARNPDAMLNLALTFGSSSPTQLSFSGERLLEAGINHFFVSVRLKDDADISSQLTILPNSVTIAEEKYPVKSDAKALPCQFGYALRKAGDEGFHTYRIPGLATTNDGTLIGVYDIRCQNGGDLPGDIDVGMSRSTDGGQTWKPMQTIMDMGDDPQWRHDGIGDPAILVDRQTGTIWVAGIWSHGNRSWHGSGPGLTPEETGQLMLVKSDDDGETWSAPINITQQVKRPEWCFLLQGPGKGITMQDGTLVFAAQYQDPAENKRLPHSTIIYSKDHGKTWKSGTGAFDDTTEAQVVETEPGVLMLNCRYNREATRVVMTTRDMGATWQEHSTSRISLIEPGACMASLISVDRELGKDAGPLLLFSNPNSLSGRNHITIKASNDNGTTWPQEHQLLLDEGSGAGYSCMTMIDEQTVGILYEGSASHLTFQRIPLKSIYHPR